MRECEDNQFDLAIADPPYYDGPSKLGYFDASISSAGVKRSGYDKTKNWNVPGEDYFTELKRISKNQIIWGINYFKIENIGPGRIVWDKVNQNSTFSDCEIAYTSSHDSVRMFSYMWNGMLQGKSISEGKIQRGNKKTNEKRIHPTQKPTAVYDWIFQNYAQRKMKIIDTHLGSGSISISAHRYNMDLVACEKTIEYAEGAKNWHDEFTSQITIFEGL